jgi:Domain of Unknown Function (DUF349)
MSFLSRILGKTGPKAAAAPTPEPPVPVTPRPDHSQRHQEEDARLSAAIDAGNWAEVGRWVLDGGSTQVRQRAAQAITDPEQLQELVRATRHGKDKNVHRILTGKRDALLEEERRVQQQQAEVDAAIAAIARHCERPVDANYAPTLRQLGSRWQAIEPHAPPEVRTVAAQQLARAHERLEEYRLAGEAEAARKRAAELAAADARQKHERETQAIAEAAAERAQALEAERQAARQRREADEARSRRLVGLLRQAQAALEQGGTARATRLRATIEELLPEASTLPPWFNGRLQQVDARLAELKDWKTFTVVPKRGELLARMQALIGAEMSAEELARHIRRLREEWRTLHRGAGEDPSPEWQQFEEAAERAYEPCREHFSRQAEQRKENQSKREALIARLAAFAAEQSGEQPNWRAIQQALVEARREWREHAPVDQAVVKPLQARFREVLDDLQARLDAEYARNAQARREIISRAAALLELGDTRQAMEQAKELQREWRTTGLVPRHQDNALWEEFRAQCDAVFQRSAQESAAHGAALHAGELRAAALCDELERIAALEAEELLGATPQIGALRDEFDALELPRASQRGLRQRFARAAERCSAAVHRARAALARRSWMDVLDVAAQVQAYATAIIDQRPGGECEERRKSVESAIGGLTHAPKAARAVIEDRWQSAIAGEPDSDLAANEAALRLLCVRAELLSGLPTPPEDEELRRDYQMKRLVAAMGQGERTGPGDLEALAIEWLGVGPVATGAYQSLRKRFESCWAAGDR